MFILTIQKKAQLIEDRFVGKIIASTEVAYASADAMQCGLVELHMINEKTVIVHSYQVDLNEYIKVLRNPNLATPVLEAPVHSDGASRMQKVAKFLEEKFSTGQAVYITENELMGSMLE
jgi:hypothetical protein